MSDKRFEVVLNEFDEVEYIMDKKLCEDKDFAEFMDFVEELAKENEQLKKECKIAVDEMVTDYKKLEKENEQLINRLTFLNKVISFFADSPMTKYSSKSELLDEMRLLEKMRLI